MAWEWPSALAEQDQISLPRFHGPSGVSWMHVQSCHASRFALLSVPQLRLSQLSTTHPSRSGRRDDIQRHVQVLGLLADVFRPRGMAQGREPGVQIRLFSRDTVNLAGGVPELTCGRSPRRKHETWPCAKPPNFHTPAGWSITARSCSSAPLFMVGTSGLRLGRRRQIHAGASRSFATGASAA